MIMWSLRIGIVVPERCPWLSRCPLSCFVERHKLTWPTGVLGCERGWHLEEIEKLQTGLTPQAWLMGNLFREGSLFGCHLVFKYHNLVFWVWSLYNLEVPLWGKDHEIMTTTATTTKKAKMKHRVLKGAIASERPWSLRFLGFPMNQPCLPPH